MNKSLQRIKSFRQNISNMMFCLLLIIFSSKINFAQKLQNDIPVTNGPANAMLKDGNTLYLAGDFTYVGPSTGRTVSLDASTGLYNPNFPKVGGINGNVLVSVSDGQGGWYIGGTFTVVGGNYRNCAAHILSDGTVDSWNPDLTYNGVSGTATVYTIVPFGKKIYIGGFFNRVRNVSRSTVVALQGDSVLAWDPQVDQNGLITAIAPTDSVIYLGGNFTSINNGNKFPNSFTRNDLACVDSSGNATPWAPAVQVLDIGNVEVIYGLSISDTTLYVWGNISSLDGYARMGIGSLYTTATTSGSYVTRWNPQYNTLWATLITDFPVVSTVLFKGDSVFVGGSFPYFGANSRTGNNIADLALVSKSTGQILPWNHKFVRTQNIYNTNIKEVNGLSTVGNILYVGGAFDTVDAQERHNLAAFDLSTDSLTNWSPNTSGIVNSLGSYGSTVFAGGTFTSVNGVIRNNIAAIDLVSRKVLPFDPNVGGGWVNALALSDTTLYIGGYFSTVGGNSQIGFAAVNKYTGTFIPGMPQAQPALDALLIYNKTLYLGGYPLFSLGDSTRHGLASIDLTTNNITSLNPFTDLGGHQGNNAILDLKIADSTLYVIGNYAMPGDTVLNRSIGAINTRTNEVLPFCVKNLSVSKAAISGNYLYAVGNFTNVDSHPQNYIAKIDRASGKASNWDPNIFIANNGSGWYGPTDIAVVDTTLYISGIDGVGGTQIGGIASINLESAILTSWAPSLDGLVSTILVDKAAQTVYMSGSFSDVNDEPQSNFAAVTDPSLGGISSVKNEQVSPQEFELMQNYPNPFNPSTIIKYSLQKSSLVTIKIYNMLGQVVRTLVEDQINPGSYSIRWNGHDDNGYMVSSGAYIYRIMAGNFSQSRKMILLK